MKPERRALLARLHIARKEMGLSDEAYRDILRRVARAESAADIADAGIVRVLDEMKRLGWKPRSGRPTSAVPHVRKIYAIWKDVRGLLDGKAGDAELRAFVRRQTKSAATPDGVSAPEFCTAEQANRVIEGLKGWLERLRKGEVA